MAAKKKTARKSFATEKDAILKALTTLLKRSAPGLDAEETNAGYTLITRKPGPRGEPSWFGGIGARKNYVSYHLMPVYEDPALLDDISPELRKRMQGKSCFNFKTVDKALFKELGELTARCKQRWKADGRI